jgi:hypothetical protein
LFPALFPLHAKTQSPGISHVSFVALIALTPVFSGVSFKEGKKGGFISEYRDLEAKLHQHHTPSPIAGMKRKSTVAQLLRMSLWC